VSDFVYLALTLLSFAGLALLVGVLDARPRPDPDSDPALDLAQPAKSPTDFATEVGLAAEEAIHSVISAARPKRRVRG